MRVRVRGQTDGGREIIEKAGKKDVTGGRYREKRITPKEKKKEGGALSLSLTA